MSATIGESAAVRAYIRTLRELRGLTQEDIAAPFVCTGVRFQIPSLGPDKGGRAFVCESPDDLTRLKAYYDELGKSSAAFFSHTAAKGPVLLQLNGELDPALAARYAAALP